MAWPTSTGWPSSSAWPGSLSWPGDGGGGSEPTVDSSAYAMGDFTDNTYYESENFQSHTPLAVAVMFSLTNDIETTTTSATSGNAVRTIFSNQTGTTGFDIRANTTALNSTVTVRASFAGAMRTLTSTIPLSRNGTIYAVIFWVNSAGGTMHLAVNKAAIQSTAGSFTPPFAPATAGTTPFKVGRLAGTTEFTDGRFFGAAIGDTIQSQAECDDWFDRALAAQTVVDFTSGNTVHLWSPKGNYSNLCPPAEFVPERGSERLLIKGANSGYLMHKPKIEKLTSPVFGWS